MSKVAKIAAAVVGVVAIVATGGLGAPLAGAVTGFLGVGAGTLTAIATGLSIAGAVLAKPPTIPSSQSQRLNLSIDPQTPRKSVVGNTALPADVRYQEWFGPNQERCGLIVAHAAHLIQSVDAIWLNDELAWTATGGVQGRFVNYFWLRQVVTEGSPSIIANVTPGSRWNSSCRLTGCAYSHIEFKVTGNSSKAESPFASGIPQRITFIGKGSPVYDPRRDSTVPGGAGPMRADDQSTWRYFADDGTPIGENVALQILREKLGWRITNPDTGAKKLSAGLGLPVKRIDLESYIVAANLCQEQVTLASGATERRFVGAAVVSEGDDPTTRLNMFCAACCGRITERAGKLGLAIAHNDLATIAADDGLNDDDLVGPFLWQPDPAITDTPNVVRGRYTDPSPNSLYQSLPYPDVAIASPDGIDRVLPLDLSAVQSPAQAQRVAAQSLMRKQYDRTLQATFDIRAWKYRIGDPLPLTLAALGFNRKPFRVVDQQYAAGGKCAMTLRIEDPAIYPLGNADRPAVQAAAPNVYNTQNNPLILAVADVQQAADGALAKATSAIAAVAGLGDDGVLSLDEKARILIPKNEELTNAWNLLDAQAALSPNVPAVVAARATAATAWQNWITYRDALTPAWNNTALNTFVNRVTFTGVLTDLRYALDLLQQALQSSIAGVPASQIADAVKDAHGNVVPARDLFAAAKAEIDAAVGAAQGDAATARNDAAQARADVAAEVLRAKDAEGTISTTLASVKTTADQAKAGVTDEATVRAAGDIALGNRLSTTEAQLAGSQNSQLQARIAAEETARANQDNAIASKVSTVEATAARATYLNRNAHFSETWSTNGYPPGWDLWAGDGAPYIGWWNATTGNGRYGPYALQVDRQGKNCGVAQWINGQFPAGWYVLEMEGRFEDGDTAGSGMLAQFLRPDLTEHSAGQLSFVVEPDSSGFIGGRPNRAFSKLVWASEESTAIKLHLMSGWDAYANPSRGFLRTIWFKAGIRPATRAEIDAKAVTDANVIARITTEETTRASQDTALANRLATTEAQLSGSQDSALRARISNEETARASQDSALANRISTTEAQLAGSQNSQLQARIAAEETARADQDAAIASRTSTVEASIGVDAASLNANPTFKVWGNPLAPPDNWFWWDSGTGIVRAGGVNGRPFSAQFNAPANQNGGIMQLMNAAFGAWVIEFTGRASDWQGAGVLAQFCSADGNTYYEEAQVSAAVTPDTSGYTSRDGGGGAYTRTFSRFYQTQINGGIRLIKLYAMANWDVFGERAAKTVVFDRVSIRPATAAEIAGQRADGNASNAQARVAVTESAIAILNGRAAAYWQVVAVAGNNRAQLTVRADANSGAGIDFGGDVTFKGNIDVGSDSGPNRVKLTNNGITFYDANGTYRGGMGLKP